MTARRIYLERISACWSVAPRKRVVCLQLVLLLLVCALINTFWFSGVAEFSPPKSKSKEKRDLRAFSMERLPYNNNVSAIESSVKGDGVNIDPAAVGQSGDVNIDPAVPGSDMSAGFSVEGCLRERSSNNRTVHTFFSHQNFTFLDVVVEDDPLLKKSSFLNACKGVGLIFNKLGIPAFSWIEHKFSTYVTNLEQLHSHQLLPLLQEEIEAGTAMTDYSATDNTVWLKRGLEFVEEMLRSLLSDSRDLKSCVKTAYYNTLEKYHSWVVKGTILMAIQTSPSQEQFFSEMVDDMTSLVSSRHQLFADMRCYAAPLRTILDILNDFYQKHDLMDMVV